MRWFWIPILLSACGGLADEPGGGLADEPGGGRHPEGVGAEGSRPPEQSARLAALHSAAPELAREASVALGSVLEAVAAASHASGVLTTHGRVVQDRPGGSVRYEASPRGALEVEAFGPDGAPVRFRVVVERFEGTQLDREHHVVVHAVVPERFDARIRSLMQPGQHGLEVEGRLRFRDEWVVVDLSVQESRTGDVDSTGSASTTQTLVRGTMEGPGYRAELEHRFDAEIVTAGGRSGQASTTQIGHRVELDGRDLAFVGVTVGRSFRDGRPSEIDRLWRAEGEVRAGPEVFGRYALRADRASGGEFLLVVLETGEGEEALERWAVR